MTFSEFAEKKLTDSGKKITSPRREIITIIQNNKGIFSPQSIATSHTKKDPTSVYRTLQLLAQLDIIHPVIHLDGELYYEKHETKHHHHAICTSCKKTTCTPCKTTTPKITGFTNLHHTSFITGLCKKCS